MLKNAGRYQERRARLRSMLSLTAEADTLILCAAIEPAQGRFVQDSTFYYFTGLNEPAAVLCIEGSGAEILFVPSYNGMRAQWVAHEITIETNPADLGVSAIAYQGAALPGYSLKPFVQSAHYQDLMAYLLKRSVLTGSLYVVGQSRWHGTYGEQLLWYLGQHIPHFNEKLVDASAMIASLRRRKDAYELACIEQAIARTARGQEAAHALMMPGRSEREIRGAIEAAFLSAGSPREAFPSIVATGINGTVLHYIDEQSRLAEGELVVVDIGATCDGYAADITRTYPVSGQFTDRQKELYTIVLKTQAHVAAHAAPGMYLNNRYDQEHSLHHMAKAYLERYGLASYMPHGIGHFMGLDVHDVGDHLVPLAPGDVITIEPGVYIPAEAIGIRIEDNYVITETGSVCLSDGIAKELTHNEGH